MSKLPLRSPSEKVGGLYHFGRMLDKIRMHARDELPSDYQPNLGKGFDAYVIEFLGVKYEDVVAQVKQGKSEDQVLQWCRANGRSRTEREHRVWNEFLRKLGWNDEVTETLARRKRESGFESRDEIQTMFQYIEADEGRAAAS